MIMRWLENWRATRKAARLEAIDLLVDLLEKSDDSGFAVGTVGDITDRVTAARLKLEFGDYSGQQELSGLFAPTGALQETAIDNGWGREFIELADRIL